METFTTPSQRKEAATQCPQRSVIPLYTPPPMPTSLLPLPRPPPLIGPDLLPIDPLPV